jgi:hypothetical protein
VNPPSDLKMQPENAAIEDMFTRASAFAEASAVAEALADETGPVKRWAYALSTAC